LRIPTRKTSPFLALALSGSAAPCAEPGFGEFRIIREEAGHVTAEQLRSIPVAQHAEIRQRLRCVAP
jgi:hypothetical protein